MSCEQGAGVPRYWRMQEYLRIAGGRSLFVIEDGRFKSPLLRIDVSLDKAEEKMRERGVNDELIEAIISSLGVKGELRGEIEFFQEEFFEEALAAK